MTSGFLQNQKESTHRSNPLTQTNLISLSPDNRVAFTLTGLPTKGFNFVLQEAWQRVNKMKNSTAVSKINVMSFVPGCQFSSDSPLSTDVSRPSPSQMLIISLITLWKGVSSWSVFSIIAAQLHVTRRLPAGEVLQWGGATLFI